MSVELEELRDTARRVLDGAGLAAVEDTVWKQIVELGWLLVAVPESLAGLGAGIQGASIMHAELGRGLSSAPYLPALLVADALCQSQTIGQEHLLDGLIGGNFMTASLADCHVVTDGSSISGKVTGVQSADKASHLLVYTAGDEFVLLVALDQLGIEVIARPTWDETRRLFDVCLPSLDLCDQIVLCEGPVAAALIQRLLVQRDFALAADSIGGAGSLLDLTVEHLKTRFQFKRPLAMFQALKHRCADMKTSITAAETMLLDALIKSREALDCPEARLNAIGAKLLATTVFRQVAEDCLQLHGGIGMADEHPCHLFLKRALLNEQLSNNNCYASRLAQSMIAVE